MFRVLRGLTLRLMLRRKNLIFSFDGTLDSDIKDNIEEICAFGTLLGWN